jgi:hypothetical protein
MSKYIKILYRIEDDIDYACLDKCPFGEAAMCGSHRCHKCKHCIGSGEISIWDLSKTKGLFFSQGYIICKQTYNEYTLSMKIMKIFHKLKLIIK